MTTRRDVLRAISATAVAVAAPVWPARLALGAAPTDRRLVVVILRGGLDGLHAAPPHGDADYWRLRPTIGVPRPGEEGGAVDLDGFFGLHPSLAPLEPLYRRGQMLVIPAATTNYRRRSHFDGQNLLENGTGRPHGLHDGWLNRALAGLGGGEHRLGLSLGHAVPLIFRGDVGVRTWAPSRMPKVGEDFLARLAYVYESDPLLAAALREGRKSQQGTAGMMSDRQPGRGGRGTFKLLSEAAGTLLAQADGPRIAVLEANGWDTHFRQEPRLRIALGELADGLAALARTIGEAWSRTAVVIVSEFGRTAAENGSAGTDHGVGGIALLLGGAVAGGRVAGDWPGLSRSSLYEGRDLRPTTAYRSIFKAALRDHLGLGEAVVEDRVFPESRHVPTLDGLFRTA